MLTTVAWILALLGAAYWGVVSWAGARTMAALVRLVDEPAATPPGLPSITIVVAARDEAQSMRHEAESIAAFDHRALDAVLVDDRSTDDTGRMLDEIAARDSRVRVIHVEELPAGWLGKVHALEQGRRVATGEWLLFTDADVDLAPDLPRRAVAFAERHRLDALALLPSLRSDSVLVSGVVATFSRWLVVGARLWRATDPDSSDAFGVGACNLVRRDALERAGGFEWLRLDVADDAALAQLIATHGGRTMLASGVDLVSVRWQDSVRGMTRGFEKYGGSGGVGSIPAAIALASVAVLGEVAPWLAIIAAILAGVPIVAWLSAATILLSTFAALAVSRRAGSPRGFWLSGPLAPVLVWWMQVRAAWLEHRRGGIVWRETFYSTAELRAAKRYRLPGFGRRDARPDVADATSPPSSVTPDRPAR